MKARTIVIVLDRFDPLYGGLESWADQWTRWLAGRGHDVHVAAFAIAPDSAGPGVVPHILPGATGRLARAAEAERFLRRMDPGCPSAARVQEAAGPLYSRAWLQSSGFEGLAPVSSLQRSHDAVPAGPGSTSYSATQPLPAVPRDQPGRQV